MNAPMERNFLADTAVIEMQRVIRKHGLEVMSRYPNDLLVHDQAVLDDAAQPGATIAWMVGHSHTHIIPLGLHPKENTNVEYLTNLSAEDRFFVMKFGAGSMEMKELTRDEFKRLATTTTPYSLDKNSGKSGFRVLRDGQPIGFVDIVDKSANYQNRVFKATIHPEAGIRGQDRAALKMWASYGISDIAGLWAKADIDWADSPTRAAKPAPFEPLDITFTPRAKPKAVAVGPAMG